MGITIAVFWHFSDFEWSCVAVEVKTVVPSEREERHAGAPWSCRNVLWVGVGGGADTAMNQHSCNRILQVHAIVCRLSLKGHWRAKKHIKRTLCLFCFMVGALQNARPYPQNLFLGGKSLLSSHGQGVFLGTGW